MYDTGTTYYIPYDYIGTENGAKSPYGDFVYAYVGVVYDGEGYKYYWISVDETGQGVKEVTSYNDLDEDKIVSDIDKTELLQKIENTGVGNRKTVKVLEKNELGVWEFGDAKTATNNIPEEGGSSSSNPVVYPEGKTKDTVSTGDLVTIGTEEFYVVSNADDKLVLLAHYNLKVGDIYDRNNNNNKLGSYSSSDSGYGLQSSDVKGAVTGDDKKGTLAFASTNYWNGQVGVSGSPFEGNYGEPYVYVYNSSSNLKTYIDNYSDYISSLGVTVKEARVLKYIEAKNLGCTMSNESCAGAPDFVHETSFWLGNANGPESLWRIDSINNKFMRGAYDNNYYYGIRPVIVI